MNKQEILEQIDELKQKIEQIEKEVKSNKDEEAKKGVRQMPEYEEKYFFVDSCGNIDYKFWKETETDLFRFNIGNCFKTEQEAEDYKENLLTKQQLKDLALELNNKVEIDWGKCNPKYFICLSKAGEFLDQCYNIYDNCNTSLYCLDENFLQLAKDRIGEDKLIKLIKSGVQNMNNETKEMFYCILEKQDSFWKQTILYVIDWLVNQGFEITYKGE